MNFHNLAQSYLEKSKKRLKILPVLLMEDAYSDVVREAQEIVELAVKGMLRAIGIDPPKHHEVSELLIVYRDKLPENVSRQVERISTISKKLRKERELSFYGDIDFIPTSEYKKSDAEESIANAKEVVALAELVIVTG